MKLVHLKNLNKVVSFLLVFCVVCMIGIVPVHAATQDVRVTNWPTSYEVTNTTWSSRLANIESATSNLATNVGNLVSRFGWNSTLTFSDGFELLYNDVHSLASHPMSGDLYDAFTKDFPYNPGASSYTGLTTKYYISQIRNGVNNSNTNLSNILSTVNNSNTTLTNIDSDIHSANTYLGDIESDTGTISSFVSNIYDDVDWMAENVNDIKVDTGNIEVDTSNISTYTNQLNTRFNNFQNNALPLIANISNKSNQIYNDLDILQEFFADADTVAQKAAAKANSDVAINTFTNRNSSSSAKASDYIGVSQMQQSIGDNLNTNVSIGTALGYFIGTNSQETGGWFSEATYNAFHAGQNNRSDNDGMRSTDAYYPLLEQYYSDVLNYTLGDER